MLKHLITGAALALSLFAVTAPAQAEGVPLKNQLITGFAPFDPPDGEILFDDGTRKTLRDFPGEVVLATFWFTTCPNCQIEMPQLNTLSDVLKKEGLTSVRILPISIDEFVFKETTDAAMQRVKTYYGRKKLDRLPVAMDVAVRNYAMLDPQGTPTTFFIGPDGKIVAVLEGAIVDWTAPESIDYLRSLTGV